MCSWSSSVNVHAHITSGANWEETKSHLETLFPTAQKFLHKVVHLTILQIGNISKELNFTLYPEDKVPVIFTAIGNHSVPLGLAMLVDPRTDPEHFKLVRHKLQVGVAVSLKGQIHGVSIYQWKGHPDIATPVFLSQFKNRKLTDSFKVGQESNHIKPVLGEEPVCQLVANSAKEALVFIHSVFGKKK